MSSLIGGRSGNRGRCAQTCRLNFDLYQSQNGHAGSKLNKSVEKHLLSCKDLCSLDILPDIIEAGVDSLKIEGRMKAPRYTAGVVSIWRKYVDLYQGSGSSAYRVEAADRKKLLDLFDRGGQTEGYYNKHNGRDMLVLREKPSHRQVNEDYYTYLDNTYVNAVKKISLLGIASIQYGKAMYLSGKCHVGGKILSAKVCGSVPSKANNRDASVEDVRKQLLKTGNTYYEFEKLDIELDKGLFIPNKALNELRRGLIEKLDMEVGKLYARRYKKPKLGEHTSDSGLSESRHFSRKNASILHVVCENKEQLDELLRLAGLRQSDILSGHYISEVSFEADTLTPSEWSCYVDGFHRFGLRVNLYLPHIYRKEADIFFEKCKTELRDTGFDGFIIRAIEEVPLINTIFDGFDKPKLIYDYTVYSFNSYARRLLRKTGASRLTLPVEQNIRELGKLVHKDLELIVYGRIPMMVSAQCLKRTTTGCNNKDELLILKDRYKADMPVKNRCTFCYNTIYNSRPLSVLGIADEIKKLNVPVLRLWFTVESRNELAYIIDSYVESFIFGRKNNEPIDVYTRGHIKRGVE